jgi:hypothetical protein
MEVVGPKAAPAEVKVSDDVNLFQQKESKCKRT